MTEAPSDRDAVVRRAREIVRAHVPIVGWLPAYPAAWRRADVVAGITSWGVMIPVAMAYAELAGLPPEVGLTTAFAALAVYAILGYEPTPEGDGELDDGGDVGGRGRAARRGRPGEVTSC